MMGVDTLTIIGGALVLFGGGMTLGLLAGGQAEQAPAEKPQEPVTLIPVIASQVTLTDADPARPVIGVIHEAQQLARLLKLTVRVRFQDVDLLVSEGSSITDLVRRYYVRRQSVILSEVAQS